MDVVSSKLNIENSYNIVAQVVDSNGRKIIGNNLPEGERVSLEFFCYKLLGHDSCEMVGRYKEPILLQKFDKSNKPLGIVVTEKEGNFVPEKEPSPKINKIFTVPEEAGSISVDLVFSGVEIKNNNSSEFTKRQTITLNVVPSDRIEREGLDQDSLPQKNRKRMFRAAD